MDDADVYLSAWWKLGIGYVYPGLVLRLKIWIGLHSGGSMYPTQIY